MANVMVKIRLGIGVEVMDITVEAFEHRTGVIMVDITHEFPVMGVDY